MKYRSVFIPNMECLVSDISDTECPLNNHSEHWISIPWSFHTWNARSLMPVHWSFHTWNARSWSFYTWNALSLTIPDMKYPFTDHSRHEMPFMTSRTIYIFVCWNFWFSEYFNMLMVDSWKIHPSFIFPFTAYIQLWIICFLILIW